MNRRKPRAGPGWHGGGGGSRRRRRASCDLSHSGVSVHLRHGEYKHCPLRPQLDRNEKLPRNRKRLARFHGNRGRSLLASLTHPQVKVPSEDDPYGMETFETISGGRGWLSEMNPGRRRSPVPTVGRKRSRQTRRKQKEFPATSTRNLQTAAWRLVHVSPSTRPAH